MVSALALITSLNLTSTTFTRYCNNSSTYCSLLSLRLQEAKSKCIYYFFLFRSKIFSSFCTQIKYSWFLSYFLLFVKSINPISLQDEYGSFWGQPRKGHNGLVVRKKICYNVDIGVINRRTLWSLGNNHYLRSAHVITQLSPRWLNIQDITEGWLLALLCKSDIGDFPSVPTCCHL